MADKERAFKEFGELDEEVNRIVAAFTTEVGELFSKWDALSAEKVFEHLLLELTAKLPGLCDRPLRTDLKLETQNLLDQMEFYALKRFE